MIQIKSKIDLNYYTFFLMTSTCLTCVTLTSFNKKKKPIYRVKKLYENNFIVGDKKIK